MSEPIPEDVREAAGYAINNFWFPSELNAVRRAIERAIMADRASRLVPLGEAVAIERPILPVPWASDKPEWEQVVDLFEQHGLQPPPWRLRDQLVGWLVWARYGALYTAEPQASVRDAVEHHKSDTAERVCFYEQDFYVLSNFSAFNLKWHGHTFPTSEHAYHWSRFALGWDLTDAEGMDAEPIAHMVKIAPSAHEAFKLAQEHRNLQHPDWNIDKVGVMRSILRAKAQQHEYVRRKLLATGDRELVEDSWRDDFWGWGPNRDGKNMLGKLWMEIRASIRALSNTGGGK